MRQILASNGTVWWFFAHPILRSSVSSRLEVLKWSYSHVESHCFKISWYDDPCIHCLTWYFWYLLRSIQGFRPAAAWESLVSPNRSNENIQRYRCYTSCYGHSPRLLTSPYEMIFIQECHRRRIYVIVASNFKSRLTEKTKVVSTFA